MAKNFIGYIDSGKMSVLKKFIKGWCGVPVNKLQLNSALLLNDNNHKKILLCFYSVVWYSVHNEWSFIGTWANTVT